MKEQGRMIEVAYLTGASYKGRPIPAGELPEAEQFTHAALSATGPAFGLHFTIERWDEPGWRAYPAALIRSTWDYLERAEAFCTALEAGEAAGVRLFNPAALVRWNSRKRYLDELAAAGVPTIPTLWAERLDEMVVARSFDALDAAELVLKPQVGAGSWRTIKLARNAWSGADLLEAPPAAAMLQPFLPAIASEGERSLFFAGGRLTHAICKLPEPGGWFANVPGTHISPWTPDAASLAVASAALAAMPLPGLYARVDLVTGLDGRPTLIELEAIEPALYFEDAPEAPAAFCRALAAALGA